MDNIVMQGTKDTPEVFFDFNNGIFSMKGRSLSENSFAFFSPIFSNTEAYFKTPQAVNTTFELKFEYLNSSSFKLVVDLLLLAKKMSSPEKKVIVKWVYEADDEDILSLGQETARITGLPFEFLPY